MAGQAYKIYFGAQQVISGTLDSSGQARHDNVPDDAQRVEYATRKPLDDRPWDPLSQLISAARSRLN